MGAVTQFQLKMGLTRADGQPHIQHRGGPKGFIKVLDEHTLALADYAGNAQYISLGNLTENDKAFIFLMDYPNRRRIKIWGTAEFFENDEVLLNKIVDPDYEARPERVLVFHVRAWSPNCTQYINQRFTIEEMAPMISELQLRISQLEKANASLEKKLREAELNPAVHPIANDSIAIAGG